MTARPVLPYYFSNRQYFNIITQLYNSPNRKLEGCCLCGEDHAWQECPSLEGKFVRKKNVACMNNDLLDEISSLSLREEVDNHAAELTVPNICWQTHEPLYLSSIE